MCSREAVLAKGDIKSKGRETISPAAGSKNSATADLDEFKVATFCVQRSYKSLLRLTFVFEYEEGRGRRSDLVCSTSADIVTAGQSRSCSRVAGVNSTAPWICRTDVKCFTRAR